MVLRVRALFARVPLWVTIGVLLAGVVAGCGAAHKARHVASGATPTGVGVLAVATSEPASITTSAIPPGQYVRGDGDADNPEDIDGNGDIDPEDEDSDYPTPASYKFPDADDHAIFAYGHAPNTAERAAISAVVTRYYTAAKQGDGAAACLLLATPIADSAPRIYGGDAGPAYLRGGKTCKAVLTMLFKHSHAELSGDLSIASIRVRRADAQVVLSSREARPTDVRLTYSNRSWKVSNLLGQILT